MNTTRIIGLLMIIAAIAIHSLMENNLTDLITGFLIGAGIALLISGSTIFTKKNNLKAN